MKKFLPLLAVTAALMAACNKDDEDKTPAPVAEPEFVIDGIRDVRVDSSIGSNLLPISISRTATSTKQEVVTLSTPDLPAGFSASFSPASGTPSFTSTVTFSYDYSGDGGTFPAKIVGTSASGAKTYTLNLTAPRLANGWMLDGEMYSTSTTNTTTQSGVSYLNAYASPGNGRVTVRFPYMQALPTSTRTVKIVNNPLAADEVALHVEDRNYITYNATGTGAPTGTFVVENGKYSFRCTNVEVANSNGAIKKRVTCKFSQ